MRTFLALIFIFSSFYSFSKDKDEIIWDILVLTEVDVQMNTYIEASKKEFLRLYPELTESMFDNEFKDVFVDYQEQLLGSYAAVYQELTFEELVKLHEFYQTETGKWLLKLEKSNTKKIQSNFAIASRVFNNGFIKKYHELGFVAP
jgi:hypothetical protein